ncbi:MAG: lipoate--protein ligase [Bacteroidales bacterium]|nr:lipoate--protein ligase [Bacteroidales bacterium]
MLIIERHKTNPYFNLATEEYVMNHFNEDCFMLWRNAPSIIIGKHQNAMAEINLDYVKQNNIDVVRRLSGGGAVFHDLGNINFTFIKKAEKGQEENLVDFHKFTEPILEFLQTLNINAKFEGRNDLTIDGKKFSGNAEHVFKNKVLHHGTLLFQAVMTDLSNALKVDESKFKDKAVKSVRSRVTNISEHLEKPMDIEEFMDKINKYMRDKYNDARIITLSQEDEKNIQDLVDKKYGTWNWNFGYSPNYNFTKKIKTNGGHLEVNLDVQKGVIKKGVIRDAKIYGDFFNIRDIEDIEAALTDCPHEEQNIRERLGRFRIEDYFHNITTDELIQAFF